MCAMILGKRFKMRKMRMIFKIRQRESSSWTTTRGYSGHSFSWHGYGLCNCWSTHCLWSSISGFWRSWSESWGENHG